jgi:nucleotide-binding universal stress UspA family protein
MTYKNLLVMVDDGFGATERIRFAGELAERFDAHLVGLYVAPVTRPDLPQLTRHARELFEEIAGQRRIVTEWRATHGFPVDVAAVQARYVDLVILGQLEPGNAQASVDCPPPEDIALSVGRPVLVAPYLGQYSAAGKRALVAWNASREATRAINDALPLLMAASSVTVLAVDPVVGRDEHGEVPGADIGLYLARHGIEAHVAEAASGEVSVGEVLLSRAADLGADFLVMGAYGHSRARELVLGGVTRTILKCMTLPVLMSH